MNITINGKQTEISNNPTISDLLNHLDLTGKPVVLEHNKTALFPRDYKTTTLQENDTVEIITIAAGG